MAETKEETGSVVICLNCGTECSGRFCPQCGQSTAVPSKLKMKNFGKSVMMSFGRLTPGFFTTAKGLLIHPWTVIRDHIQGRQIRYSPPVTMLIQVFLYASIIYAVVDAIFGTSLLELYNFKGGIFNLAKEEDVIPLLVMVDQSVVLQAILKAVPMCFIVYLAYFRHGARKYNFAEYMVAFVYMFATLVIYDTLFNLLNVIPGIDFPASLLTFFVMFAFTLTLMIKAFPQNKWWKHLLLFFWTAFLFLGLVIMLAVILG